MLDVAAVPEERRASTAILVEQITRRKASRFRPCRLTPAPLKQATDWIERHRRTWEESLDKLDAYLTTMQATKPADRKRKPSH